MNKDIEEAGYTIVDGLYTAAEIGRLKDMLERIGEQNGPAFRKSADLFAVRQFLNEVPAASELIFNEVVTDLVKTLFGADYFLIKSIYFDKPAGSNWFVAYHQDLTISVDRKVPLNGFGPWTVKNGYFGVQPPLEILRNIYTLRIHLDDTDEHNGALKVIPGSHSKGIYRPDTIDWTCEKEMTCRVPAGGAMIMKPLLLHSSARTTNQSRRRVIHLEFSSLELPTGLKWEERADFPAAHFHNGNIA